MGWMGVLKVRAPKRWKLDLHRNKDIYDIV